MGNSPTTVRQRHSNSIFDESLVSEVGAVVKPVENSFPERYKIHQYWSRKPWYVVRAYIKNFTQEGELVLDPFSGSGVTACESLITRRRFIGIDINPISILLTKLTCIPRVDLEKIKVLYSQILDAIQPALENLYSTKCRRCNATVQIINTVWNNGAPSSVFYKCNACKFTANSNVSELDKERCLKIESIDIPYWYPKNVRMPPDSDVSCLEDLFTRRNLYALSHLFHEIENLPKTTESDFILLMFLSSLVRCSKLIFVNEHRFSKNVNPAGVWGEKRFWVPSRFIENNVCYYFSARLKKILKAKEETNKMIDNTLHDAFRIIHGTATNLQFIANNSVDYCFTDPPYGGSIRYMDLSVIWNSWLRSETYNNNEIVVSKEKSITRYSKMMDLAFSEIFRVLKPGHFMSVTFHNSNPKIWNIFLDACCKAGFALHEVVIQKPSKTSHNQINMQGTVKTDIVLTFQKSRAIHSLETSNQSLEALTRQTIHKMYLSGKRTAVLHEIYDAVLILWILNTYRSSAHVRQFPALSEIENILLGMDLNTSIRFDTDYKGKKRRVSEWDITDSTQ